MSVVLLFCSFIIFILLHFFFICFFYHFFSYHLQFVRFKSLRPVISRIYFYFPIISLVISFTLAKKIYLIRLHHIARWPSLPRYRRRLHCYGMLTLTTNSCVWSPTMRDNEDCRILKYSAKCALNPVLVLRLL